MPRPVVWVLGSRHANQSDSSGMEKSGCGAFLKGSLTLLCEAPSRITLNRVQMVKAGWGALNSL